MPLFHRFWLDICASLCLSGRALCLTPQARGTARARPVKVLNSEGTPRHAQGTLNVGTGTPNHMTGVPGRACAWACQAHGTDEARPGQSLIHTLHTRSPFKAAE